MWSIACFAAFAQASAEKGILNIDVTDTVGNGLACRVQALKLDDAARDSVEAPKGVLEWSLPSGDYRVYVEVYDRGVPVLVDVRDVQVAPGGQAFVPVNLIEWGGETLSLRDFDYDGDLAIDRVELASGTDPNDGASIPGRPPLEYPAPVLQQGARWYKGELFARSNLGEGKESVKELVSRAEKENMDFLAIADRGHIKSASDPAFKSDKVVLIPAMQWGSDDMGWALIYGPRTMPDPPGSKAMAGAECIRVQSQGGVFAIAHPCLPASPWKWGLSYVNAMQVWYRGWNEVPPMGLALLPKELQARDEGRLVYSIAAAAASADFDTISANAQAAMFWDYELVRGLMASAIAGTGTSSSKVPMGKPITYIHAREKSLAGILEGLRLGRTYVSSGPEGPQLAFRADIGANGKVEIGIGGVVPLNVETAFEAAVRGGTGMKLQVLHNGYPLFTKIIESDPYLHKFNFTPKEHSAFRLRVISPEENPKAEDSFGRVTVHAMSSPIYAQDVTAEAMAYLGYSPDKAWIKVDEKDVETEADLPEPEQAETLNIDYRSSFGRYKNLSEQAGTSGVRSSQPLPQGEETPKAEGKKKGKDKPEEPIVHKPKKKKR